MNKYEVPTTMYISNEHKMYLVHEINPLNQPIMKVDREAGKP